MKLASSQEEKPSFRMLLGLTIALAASLCALEHGKPFDGQQLTVGSVEPIDWIEEDPIPITKALPKPPPKTDRNRVVTASIMPQFEVQAMDPSDQRDLPDIDLSWLDEIVTVETAVNPVIDPLEFPDAYPEFPGGEPGLAAYIAKHLTYPDYAKINRIQGTVYIKFAVDAKGHIDESTFEVLGSPHFTLTDEVIRLIKNMPQWKPGQQGPRKVPVYMKLPVKFAIQ